MLIGGIVNTAIMGFFLFLDGIVYNFVRWFYQIFLFLAQLNLFDTDDYISIVNRLYIIIGVVMLFILAYSLLKAIIDPDEFAKGEASFPNLIKNVVISLIIIVLLPTVFDVAYRMQNAILRHDVIGKIFLSENYRPSDIDNGGNLIASKTFSAFLYATEEGRENSISSNTFFFWGGDLTFQDALDEVERGESFLIFTNFSQAVDDAEITYNVVVSTIAGLFLLWCILLFCFDLGTRVVKLIFYQTIAPVAVICRILPGGKAKSVFSNWVKLTLGTFAEVFIRVAVMYMGVYLIKLIDSKFHSISINADDFGLGIVQQGLVLAFLIMGVIAFMRQAPKLIQDLFGLELGGLNLGLKGLTSRLADGGALAAASAIGGGATAMVRNFNSAKGLRRLTSGLGGLGSGAVRGLRAGAGAQGFGDVRNAASTAASRATDARVRRNARNARYDSEGRNFITGHLADFGSDVSIWATGGMEKFKPTEDFIKTYIASIDAGDKYIDELYTRNASNSKVQEMFLNNMLSDATDRINEYTQNGFDADTEYKDALGNVRRVTSQQELDQLLIDMGWQYANLEQQAQHALSKEAMESLVSSYSSQGFQGVADMTDFYGEVRRVNNEQEFAAYVSDLKKQLGDIDRGSKKVIKNAIMDAQNGADILNEMAVNTNHGDQIRIDQARSNYNIAVDYVSENKVMAAGLNVDGSVPELDSYKALGDYKDQLEVQMNNIAQEKAKLERAKAARDASRSGGGGNS